MASAETLKGVEFKGLVAGPEFPLMTKNVTLAKGQKVVTGKLLTLDSATATGGKATAVAAEDVEATDAAVVTVFVSGYFNRDALKAADGDTVTAHEEELRTVGIYLSQQH